MFIARYRDDAMHRKVALLHQQENDIVRYIYPLAWHDELSEYRDSAAVVDGVECAPVQLIGPQTDPHRVMYRTLGFGMRAFHPHVVHVEEEPDSLAALQVALSRRLSAPRSRLILNTWQNIDRPKNALVKAVIRFSLAESSAVMCANSEAVHLLQLWGYVKPTPLIPAIGVDTRLFYPGQQQDMDAGIVNVIYIGRFVPEKGIDTLIASMASLIHAGNGGRLNGNLRLRLIGNGPYLNMLKQQVEDAGITSCVEFLASMPPAGVAEVLRQSHILVLPSRTTDTWKEQFGRVLTEAMACKIPVIGSDSGAIPEVIGDAGLTFQEGNVGDLALKLSTLLHSPDMRTNLAGQGHSRVNQHYTQERIATQTVEFYRHLVTSTGGGEQGER
ncbi:MAG: glycosyltransferase family 4 protein [Chloroflexi bacterium]|nr:glycosyltransferase family 4 protein [Chloroflexota bacterium]